MPEPITLQDRQKQSRDGTAEVRRYGSSQRLAKAIPVAVGGTILGLCTIIIPGLHFITTWLIPLLSIGVAVYLYNRLGAIHAVRAECPSCNEAFEAEGGPWEDPMWIRCAACQAPLEVQLKTPMAG